MIPVQWKASIEGAEDVKTKLAEIRAEYESGQMGIQEYGEKQRFLVRQARSSNLSLGAQKSIFLATHPVLNKLSQAMSVYGSVSRSVLSIMNAINLVTIKNNQFSERISDLNIEIIEQKKRIRELEEAGLGGTAVHAEEIAKLKELVAQLTNVNKEADSQRINDYVTSIAGIGTAVAISVQTIITALPHLKKLKDTLTALIPISWASAGPWGVLAAVFIAVAIAANQLGNALGLNQLSLEGISYWWYSQGQPALDAFLGYFTKGLPLALVGFGATWKNVWDGIKKGTFTIINSIIGGFQTLINAFIHIINTFIEAYNRVAKKLHLSTIGKLGEVKLPTLGESATGTTSTAVPFAGSQFAGSAGGVIVMNIAGSILSERELKDLTGAALKERLKRAGYG